MKRYPGVVKCTAGFAAAAFAVSALQAAAYAQETPPAEVFGMPAWEALQPPPQAWEAASAHLLVGVWDTIVAVNTDNRTVFGMNASDGRELWRKPSFYSPEKAALYTPATDGKHAWLAMTDTLYCVQARDGKPIFEAPLEGEIEDAPVFAPGLVIALVSKIAGESGARERILHINGYDAMSGRVQFSIAIDRSVSAMFAADRDAMVAYTLLRRMDSTPVDRYSLFSYSLPEGKRLSTGIVGDINGHPRASVSRLAIAGPGGAAIFVKDMMLRPLNRFGRDVREGAADVAIAGKRAVFVQGARVTAADVNSPAVPWSFMVEGTTPADPPSMSNILLTAVGQRLAYPAYSGNRPVIIAFDAQTGLNVRAGRGFTGLTSTTYFKNLLVMADGKRSFAVDLDRLMPLHRKPAEAPAESKAEE